MWRANILFLGALLVGSGLRAEVTAGQTFPSLAESALVGSVPDTKGKVVLVDFWASWCVPCKASFPVLAQLQQEYGARGLVIVGVGIDEKPNAFAAFAKKMKPGFALVHDASQRLVAEVKVPSMPTSYLVGRDGRLRSIHSGFHGESSERELRKAIEASLTEK